MIEINDLTKMYGDATVLDGLTLTIPKGSVFGFLGQNGAGKTTAMKIMVGLAMPDTGTVTIGGKPCTDSSAREHIGYMPEAPYFYDRLTGLEFLRFCCDLFTAGRNRPDSYLGDILKRAGIYDARDRAIATYSKGMKQRLGFAQTLVNDPKYIFLDEPLDGLDPIGRREIKEIIRGLHAEGKTIFFNSHILYDTERLCDAIGIIHEGKLLYSGPVAQFCGGRSLEDRFVETVEAHKAEHPHEQ
jgi:ABC-2 type transport system ATP-binding protein